MLNNHLKNSISLNSVQLEKSNIAKFSAMNNITKKLIEEIDFNDKTFINRLDCEETIKKSEDFLPLLNSIKDCGLLNPIYLLEVKENKYIIISGWRRSLSLKVILEENPNKIWQKQAVIFRENTPLNLLEKISIDENTKRKNLSIIELSYKFNKISEIDKLPLEDCLNIFGIAKSQFYAIKKAIDFDPIIKELLEDVGPIKADLLDKILIELTNNNKNSKVENKKTIELYKEKTRVELKEILQNLKKSKNKNVKTFDLKRCKNKTVITINQNMSDEEYSKIREFILQMTKNNI
ncbi:MAG: ParB N-terminal domain-containing protein [Cetobacterium sp.]